MARKDKTKNSVFIQSHVRYSHTCATVTVTVTVIVLTQITSVLTHAPLHLWTREGSCPTMHCHSGSGLCFLLILVSAVTSVHSRRLETNGKDSLEVCFWRNERCEGMRNAMGMCGCFWQDGQHEKTFGEFLRRFGSENATALQDVRDSRNPVVGKTNFDYASQSTVKGSFIKVFVWRIELLCIDYSYNISVRLCSGMDCYRRSQGGLWIRY